MRITPAEAGTLAHERGIVIFGERHGTNEFPNMFVALATASARNGPLVVALELDDGARDPTAAYMRSDGSPIDRKRLLLTESWQRQDGRASEAMYSLVESIRRQVQAGASIEVDVFDVVPAGDPLSHANQTERERQLAERLLAIRSRGVTLALAGNVHAELVRRPDAPRDLVPAAALVAQDTDLVALVGRHAGGTSWCTLPIDGRLVTDVHPVVGEDLGPTPFIELEPDSSAGAGVAYVGKITPSPPAVPLRSTPA